LFLPLALFNAVTVLPLWRSSLEDACGATLGNIPFKTGRKGNDFQDFLRLNSTISLQNAVKEGHREASGPKSGYILSIVNRQS
jgi:hypothetical protein